MRNSRPRLCTLSTFSIVVFALFALLASRDAEAQVGASGPWTDVMEKSVPVVTERVIVPDAYRMVRLDRSAMADLLASVPMEGVPLDTRSGTVVPLPAPSGNFVEFRVVEAPIMAPGLQERFPEMRSYYGRALDGSGRIVRFSSTPKGFRALVLGRTTYLIDPFQKGDTQHYVVYRKADYSVDRERIIEAFGNERVLGVGERGADSRMNKATVVQNGTQLRTYELALAATAEYTNFHGGTVEDALDAQTVAMTRVNGIYERDLAIRMELIANNDDIIYTPDGDSDPFDSDPYTNGDAGALLNENQTNLDNEIGSGNYDIGHVFSTGGGGLASLGVVCTNRKARGETGLGSPIGDVFYVDFVAHEIGHQFNANHTFNGNSGNCSGNRNGSTAYEPGSGSTIMAYAGICGGQDLQGNSDDYFHDASLEEIVNFVTSGSGSSCPVVTSTGNSLPQVTANNDGVTIPQGTPFFLAGSATDADPEDDPSADLRYAWEEFDLGPAGPPAQVSGWTQTPPFFRSFDPLEEPKRYFPQLDRLLDNDAPVVGEGLPTDERTLTFRLTARDARGGIGDEQISIDVDGDAGPFEVTFANTSGQVFTAGAPQEVTWNVAGTDANDVQTDFVDVLYSETNGPTFPTVLAAGTPNDGSATLTFPSAGTGGSAEGRIMIVGTGNVFFDVNDEPFVLNEQPVAAGGADRTVEATKAAGADVTLDGSGSSDPEGDFLSYSWTVGAAEIATGASPTVTLSLGTHAITLEVTDPDGASATDDVNIEVVDTTPPEITLNGSSTITHECGEAFADPGATAFDAVSGDLTGSIVPTSTVSPDEPGEYSITYEVADGAGNSATKVRTVKVIDTTPPTITVTAEPRRLWPANHKYHTVSLGDLVDAATLSASDGCDDAVGPGEVTIDRVTSDEPENAAGDGNTSADIIVAGNCQAVQLRAERQGNGNGRVYTLHLEVMDASGNTGTATYEVHVPLTRTSIAVDDGPSGYDQACGAAPATTVKGTPSTPSRYDLRAAFPNPFGSSAAIHFSLPETAPVTLVVYDALGREVARLVDRTLPAGQHTSRFDGTHLPSGTYLYRFTAGSFTDSGQMVLIR